MGSAFQGRTEDSPEPKFWLAPSDAPAWKIIRSRDIKMAALGAAGGTVDAIGNTRHTLY